MAGLSIASVLEALKRRGQEQSVDERAASAKAGAEKIARKLPAAVMPTEGISEDRRRKGMIDDALKGEE